MKEIVVVAHDIRSTYNVGSLLRTCEGLGVSHVYFTGYTPYPSAPADSRLPHIATKLAAQIHKTALGAEILVPWSHHDDVVGCLTELKQTGYTLVALEQTPDSIKLPDFHTVEKTALLLGREVEGIAPELLSLCDTTLEIPMFGHKESFNVVQAAAMVLYQFRFG